MSNSTTAIADSVAKELSCGICFHLLDNPRVLPCGHSFCTKDLKQYFLHTTPSCPYCMKLIYLPDGKVESLPVNFSVKNLVENMRGELEKYEQQESMQLFFLSSDSKHRTVSVTREDTVASLKLKICEKDGQTVDSLIVSYQGKPLVEDSRPLSHYGIRNLARIEVYRRVRGGTGF